MPRRPQPRPSLVNSAIRWIAASLKPRVALSVRRQKQAETEVIGVAERRHREGDLAVETDFQKETDPLLIPARRTSLLLVCVGDVTASAKGVSSPPGARTIDHSGIGGIDFIGSRWISDSARRRTSPGLVIPAWRRHPINCRSGESGSLIFGLERSPR